MPNGQFGIRRQGQVDYAFSQNYLRISADDGERVRIALVDPGGRIVNCHTAIDKAEFDAGLAATVYGQICAFSKCL